MWRQKLASNDLWWHRRLLPAGAGHPKSSLIFGEGLAEASSSMRRKEPHCNTPSRACSRLTQLRWIRAVCLFPHCRLQAGCRVLWGEGRARDLHC